MRTVQDEGPLDCDVSFQTLVGVFISMSSSSWTTPLLHLLL